jgi:hypothetical protein
MPDPFESLRGAAAPVDPDPDFVDAVMQAVRDRLEPGSGARSSTTRSDLPHMEIVPNAPRPAARQRPNRWWFVAAAWAAIVAGGLTTLTVLREEDDPPANYAPAASREIPAAQTLSTNPPIIWKPCEPTGSTQKGNFMNRWAIPTATAAAATMLLGACGDDGPTTLAEGNDVELTGNQDLAGQTLDINAEDNDGDVTGEIRFTDSSGQVVVTVECADTDTDGVVIIGGTATGPADPDTFGGKLVALFIKEGDPDRVAVWVNDDDENKTCSDLLQNRRDVLDDETLFVDVEAGSDITTG